MTQLEQSMPPERHYEHLIWDTKRWDGFTLRSDDILVCTPYKSGTTWMQTICALLIFQSDDFGKSLSEISPWMEIKTEPVEQVHKLYDAQTHRRFIKTHTARDGLPQYPGVTHLVVLRDPRDIFMSMLNHMQNMNPEGDVMFMPALLEAMAQHPPPEDPNEFFRMWLTNGTIEGEQDGAPFWSTFRHGYSFWQHKDDANTHLFHFSDMKADLDGQMRRVADVLNIEVPDGKWPELVDAARFGNMKKNAGNFAPEARFGIWKDNSRFFNKGTSGQWHDVLDAESLALLEQVTSAYPQDYINWLIRG